MRSLFLYMSVINYVNVVCQLNRAQSVTEEQCGSSFTKLCKFTVKVTFRNGIQSGCRFIQYTNWCFTYKASCKGGSLPFTARKILAFLCQLTQQCILTILKAFNNRVQFKGSYGIVDCFIIRSANASYGDIIPD